MHAATWNSIEGVRFSGNMQEFQVKTHAFILNMQPVYGIVFGKRSWGISVGIRKESGSLDGQGVYSFLLLWLFCGGLSCAGLCGVAKGLALLWK